jgi:hypothetical protein
LARRRVRSRRAIGRNFDKLGKKGDLDSKIVVSQDFDDVFGGNLRGAFADASVFIVASI